MQRIGTGTSVTPNLKNQKDFKDDESKTVDDSVDDASKLDQMNIDLKEQQDILDMQKEHLMETFAK